MKGKSNKIKMSEADTFQILVATDNHLGYAEKDPIRGNDSLETFEEILRIAVKSNVDMILLGGDLFHENKPSRKTLHKTMELLRKYCLGDRPCAMEFLSDRKANFPSNSFGNVNYEDPNLNVSLPVFSIHGNHDDPTGDGNLCSLDLLSVCGLINYFGKASQVDDITINPILLKKGQSRLALYGLGNVRDERLHRTFKNKKVQMMKPNEYENEWFNLMVLHQNRVKHGPTNYIPEAFIDDFIHLVIWGHEHECLIDPEFQEQQEFYISQPGSSVATALSEGESKSKHVGILRIRGQEFSMKKVRLETVRPFIMDDLVLSEVPELNKNKPETVLDFLAQRVEEMIEKVMAEWKDENKEMLLKDPTVELPKPIVRLRVEYSGFTNFNVQRFGQQFVSTVANPKDILLFHRKKSTEKKGSRIVINDEAVFPDQLDMRGVEDLVSEFLENQQLQIFPEKMLTEAVKEFVDKDEKDAIKDFVTKSLTVTREYLVKKVEKADEDSIFQEIEIEKQTRSENFEKQRSTLGEDGLPDVVLPGTETRPKPKPKKPKSDSDNDMDADPMISDDDNQSKPKKGKQPAKKAAASKKKANRDDDEDEDEDEYKAAFDDESDGDDASFMDDDNSIKSKPGKATTAKPRGRGGASTSRAKATKKADQPSSSGRGRGRGGRGGARGGGRTLDSIIQGRKTVPASTQSAFDVDEDSTKANPKKRKLSNPSDSQRGLKQSKLSFVNDDSDDEAPQSNNTAASIFDSAGTNNDLKKPSSYKDRWSKKN